MNTQQKYVYFVQAGEGGPIKIGCSVCPYYRVVSYSAGSFEQLTLLGSFKGNRLKEHAIQHQFRDLRFRKEWFVPAPELLSFIEKHCRYDIGRAVEPTRFQQRGHPLDCDEHISKMTPWERLFRKESRLEMQEILDKRAA